MTKRAQHTPCTSDWDDRCSEVLRRNAHSHTNNEIAALIEGATGKRFSVSVVSRRRAALGLDSTHRNDWSAPLTRWRVTRRRLD
jgi:hypothetical protein